MRILFLSLPNMGGCQRVTVNYAKILAQSGYKCHFLFWVDKLNDENEVRNLLPAEITYDQLCCRLRELPMALYKYIRKHGGFDCVFSSWLTFNLSLCISKCLPFNKIGHLVLRDDNMPSRHGQKYIKAYRMLGNKADIMIAQTQEMMNEFATVYHLRKNTIVVSNPMDKAFIQGCVEEGIRNGLVLEGSPVYIASGRINPQKDYLTLVKAYNKVLEKQPQALLYILGAEGLDSDYGKEVKKEIVALVLENKVRFLGFQNNPFQYIHAADVFVLSSIYEGLPNVMIEAIYIGTPVAATTCIPYIGQTVKEGESGYTAEPQNPEQLAKAMMNASSLPKRALGVDVNESEEQIIQLFRKILTK